MDCATTDHLVQLCRSVLAARDREIAALRAKAAALDEIAETLDLSTDDPIQVATFVAGQNHGLIELADEVATLRTHIAGRPPKGDQ